MKLKESLLKEWMTVKIASRVLKEKKIDFAQLRVENIPFRMPRERLSRSKESARENTDGTDNRCPYLLVFMVRP